MAAEPSRHRRGDRPDLRSRRRRRRVDGPGTTPGVIALYSAGRHASNRAAWLLAVVAWGTYLLGTVLVVPRPPATRPSGS
ncbi:hypothetical protein ACFQX6_38600 [Streptosporangium lutulentum]